jgi:hypothetical protein
MKDTKKVMVKVNKEEQIHDNINFYKCSINLLFGRKKSGKPFNVSYEMVKLGYIQNFGEHTK